MTKTNNLIFSLFILSTLGLTGCYYNSEERLYGLPTTDSVDCKTNTVTYTNTIRQFMINHCVACHGPNGAQGGVSLHTYDLVKRSASKIKDCINHKGGCVMPPGPKLPSTELVKYEAWLKCGQKE